jgi:hypothetical protein
MISNKKELMEVVNHYKENGEYETAKRFLKNFPMKTVNIGKEIEKIEKLQEKEKVTIVEPENVKEDKS